MAEGSRPQEGVEGERAEVPESTPESTPGPRPHRAGARWSGAAAGAVVLVLGAVAALAWLAVRDVFVAGAEVSGPIAPLLITVYGVPLVVAAAVSAVAAWPLRRRVRRSATAVAVAAAGAALALAVPVAMLWSATVAAGGSVDVVSATLLTTAPAVAPDDYPVYFTTSDGEQLHLAVVRPRASTRPAPVLVLVHGGGWSGGSELGRLSDMDRWAQQGWLVVSVQYTLAGPGRPTWDLADDQVACALSRVAATAGVQGGDPTRLVLGGDSAGGQLAISVAYHAASGTQPSSCGGAVPVPRSVVAEYPAVDLVDGYEHGARSPVPGLDAPSLAAGYIGGTPAQFPERYRAVSGTAAITSSAPPTLVLAPSEDVLVPPASLTRFVAAAQGAGVQARLVRLPFADHAFDTFADGSLGHQAGLSIMQSWSRAQVGL